LAHSGGRKAGHVQDQRDLEQLGEEREAVAGAKKELETAQREFALESRVLPVRLAIQR
jgi:hypothetical protein